ncbi:MAG: phytanoyl-CoA dioxygenase family protein [Planctomycetota bacterium]
MTPSTHNIDNHSPSPHAPELYAAQRTAEYLPDVSAVDGRAIQRFHETGYLAFERVLSDRSVADALEAIDDLAAGKNAQFNDVLLESKAGGVDPASLDPIARADLVRRLMAFTQFDDRLEAVMREPRLVGLVRTLLGDEPACFQEMALLKPPGGGREKPWHQDHAYFDFAQGTPIVGVWIALDPADAENGCMHLVEGTHHEIVPHFNRRDWQICDTEVMGRPVVTVPLPPGGAMVFSGLLMHGTPANHSSRRRRALQFHYAGEGAERCATEERLRLFGSEGRDVTC